MKTSLLYCTSLLVFFLPVISKGTLGEAVKEKSAKIKTSQFSQKAGAGEKFSVYEYEQNGNTVKEFSSMSGVVFAVSWQGISKPDLNALFGTYLKEYNQAFDEVPKQYGVKNLSLKTSKMVIRRGGRMRDQKGFIYIPSLVPEGVSIEELQ